LHSTEFVVVLTSKVAQSFDNLGRADARGARRRIVPSTRTLVFAAAAALAATMTEADAGAREISGSSYSFADSLLANNGLGRPTTLSALLTGWSPGCFVNCGPAFGTFVVRRSDLLTSNTADVSPRRTADATGHPMGVGGMVVIERLESDGSGSLMNWAVVSESALDDNGAHSWSLVSGADAPWLPSNLYQFEGSSFSFDLVAERSATPEASTWVMTLISLAAVTFARYRTSKSGRFSTFVRKGALV
jgi:hypothetical protein